MHVVLYVKNDVQWLVYCLVSKLATELFKSRGEGKGTEMFNLPLQLWHELNYYFSLKHLLPIVLIRSRPPIVTIAGMWLVAVLSLFKQFQMEKKIRIKIGRMEKLRRQFDWRCFKNHISNNTVWSTQWIYIQKIFLILILFEDISWGKHAEWTSICMIKFVNKKCSESKVYLPVYRFKH